MEEKDISVVIMLSGRITGEFQPIEDGLLRLKRVVYPEERFSFDIGLIPYTLTNDGEPLPVILLGEIAYPHHTQINARLVGGIQKKGFSLYALAIPNAETDKKSITSFDNLNESVRREIEHYLSLHQGDGVETQWLRGDEIEARVREARSKFRMIQVENYQREFSQPAWKPLDVKRPIASYKEAESYTAAEYTFHQLPGQIQRYVSEYLDDDERILYAVRRPAMRSQLFRSWFGREKLQEGVLILTTQRLIQLVELVPPGDSGVRYGFNAALGIVERLKSLEIRPLGDDVILLKTFWESQQGLASLEWEAPLYSRSELVGLTGFLERFLPFNLSPFALRRAAMPPPDELPALIDPASTNPEETKPLFQRFAEVIPSILLPGEVVYTWALWPEWFEEKGFARVIVVTNNRLLIVPDPDYSRDLLADVNLKKIATLEYAGSILRSFIHLTVVESGAERQIQWSFPYTADGPFHRCFEAVRRCMASLPLQE